MLAKDEDALLCDLAETYGIYDIEALPIEKIATFAIGLKGNSRIKMKMTNEKVTTETMLLAGMLDRLSFLVWTKTKDAQHNRNRPESVVDRLLNGNKKPDSNYEVFESGDALLAHLEKLRKGAK